ncbi:nucleoside hydrolase [Clostridium sp. AM58-1XD]|uniref:nucleoside hydrolase n=1 Tax=Clostridium sp. AM58-1XD TaxID=2292307 RepID=UPI000E4870DE|nr:nucleoside hydrolase [Clostridium sp. AM58-1XD]RGY95861.1 nucleoside hydrolase [Clostridium sp. AM58-1XD]
MKKRKVLIDCDPGIDDSLTLMLALTSPELEIVGITTVCGNVPPDMGAQNVRKVLKLMGRLDIPVYQGADRPLVKEYVSAQDTHGMDGLGEAELEEIGLNDDLQGRIASGAAEFIQNILRSQEQISIIAIGPLTNIAEALKADRSAFAHLDMFVSMGGSFKSHGNCSPVAEYNYWCDPDAAEFVYQNLGTRIHMVGLDVTRKIVLTPNILEYMKVLNREIGRFIEAITRFYFDFHWKYEGIIGCVINDPLAVAYLIRPELCRGFDAYTAVDTEGLAIGQTIVDSMNFWHKKANSHVLTEVDELEFMTMFLARLFDRKEEEVRDVLNQIMVTGGGSR